jgi:hypothetical protein
MESLTRGGLAKPVLPLGKQQLFKGLSRDAGVLRGCR